MQRWRRAYVGLVAAGLSQAAAQALPGSSAASVLAASLATFAVGSVVIYTRVPRVITALPLRTHRREAGPAAVG